MCVVCVQQMSFEALQLEISYIFSCEVLIRSDNMFPETRFSKVS